MTESSWKAKGLAGRRRRSTDAESRRRSDETRQLMLETAVSIVEERGLTVSFAHLSFEDIIREADVPRTAAYRVWSYKEDFFGDLMRELAGHTSPGEAAFDQGTVVLAAKLALAFLPQLGTVEGRRSAIVEVCRQGSRQNFDAIYGSPIWQTYVALIATLGSIGEGKLQTDVERALNRTELHFVKRMASFYRTLSGFFGFRVRSEIPDPFETLTTLGSAIVEGLALKAAIVPSVADTRLHADPFSTGNVAEWSLPSIGYTSLVLGILEPDPSYDAGTSREMAHMLEAMISADAQSSD